MKGDKKNMYVIYDKKTKINRGFAVTLKDAKELTNNQLQAPFLGGFLFRVLLRFLLILLGFQP